MSTSRIPYDIPNFKKYVRQADDFFQVVIVPTNGERLGLTPANVADWHLQRQAVDTLFGKRENETLDASVITSQVQPMIKSFHIFANPLIDVCAASPNATQADATLLNFVLIPNSQKGTRAIVNADLFYKLEAVGGGELEVHTHTDSDKGKAHLAPGADSVQTSYVIGDKELTDPEQGNKDVHRSASFFIKTGVANRGQKVSVRMRWYNSRHPELSGQWTAPQTFIIL